jgi:hypothetical protein
MPSSGMLRRVVLIKTDVSEEHIASVIKVTRISELGKLAVTSNQSMLQRNTGSPSQCTSVASCTVPGLPILVTLTMEAIRSSKCHGSCKSHMA